MRGMEGDEGRVRRKSGPEFLRRRGTMNCFEVDAVESKVDRGLRR